MKNLDGVVKMLKNEQARLVRELHAIGSAISAFGTAYGKGPSPRGRMSAAGRARIASAQRARWAKVKASNGTDKTVAMPKKRTMSAAARKKIAAAQRKRWARVRAAK